jgi:hypothetical protein
MLFCQLYLFFGGVYVKVFDLLLKFRLFLLLLLSLYILSYSLIANTSFANISPQSVTCLQSLNSVFCIAEILSFNENHLINFFPWITFLGFI